MRSNTRKNQVIEKTAVMFVKEMLINELKRKAGLLTLGLSSRQWTAMWLICLMLLPIFSAPVSAAVWNQPISNEYSHFEPVNPPQPIWKQAQLKFNLAMERWLMPVGAPELYVAESAKNETKINFGAEKASVEANKENGRKAEEKVTAKTAKTSAIEKTAEINKTDESAASVTEKKGAEKTAESSSSEDKPQIKAPVKNNASPVAVRQPLIVNQLPSNEQESLFYPENNLGSPAGKTEQSAPNQAAVTGIKERNGIGNFSFDIGFASLTGRGISASAGAVYNSRVWNKSRDVQNNQDRYTYNVDNNWLAPGFAIGYGSLDGSGQVPKYLTDPSGNRHQLFYNASASGGPKTVYDARDGSFIRVVVDTTYNRQRTYARYSDGSTIYFDHTADAQGHRRSIMLVDNNGNYVHIGYVPNDTAGRISFLQDSLDRYIKFYYDAAQRLAYVTVPELGSAATPPAETETIRFYYKNITLDPRFAGAVDAPTSAVSVLEYVYFPGTQSGFKYEYSPLFGMIYKITRFEGMTLSADKSSVISEGQWAAKTEYNYPLYASHIPNPGVLNDVPEYTTRTDDWIGRDISSNAPVTNFSSVDNTTNEITTSTITSPDGTVQKTVLNKKNIASIWDNGLIKETSVTDSTGNLMQKSVLAWDPNSTANPRLLKVENTNDADQVSETQYQQYDQYNNVTVMSVHDFGTAGGSKPELKRVETTYETGATDPGWINRRLVHLPKSIKVYEGTTIVSRTEYEYDYNGDGTQLTERGSIGGHLRSYNPYLPPVQVCTEPDEWGKVWCITTDSYDTGSDYRGNVTKVTSWADPTNEGDPLKETNVMKYDVFGNLVSATLNCCQLRQWIYTSANGYAYPMEIKSGQNGEFSQKASYDFNTGLVLTTTDENHSDTNNTEIRYEYETDTLRQKKVIYPNGGYTLTEYSDKLMTNPADRVPGFVRQTTTLTSSNMVQSYNYFDGRGASIRTATETATNGWSVSAIGYDAIGRAEKSYNPFYSTQANGAIPADTKYTKVVNFDGLGRAKKVEMQDGTFVETFFDEAAVSYTDPDYLARKGTATRVVDQAGRERRQIVDALGRVIRLDEPDKASGSLGSVTAPAQPTHYYYDGNDNLSKVVQIEGTSRQERKFKYDSLSRLTHEKQVEAIATLNDTGGAGNQWTKVLKYDGFGRLVEAIDARGVRTLFDDYDNLNRIEHISYTDDTPDVTYIYDQPRNDASGNAYSNKHRLTRVETQDGSLSGRADTPATATEFDYDKMGRVVKHRQTIGTQTYNLEYVYNLAGQLTKEIYPSGREVSTGYDTKGRMASVSDASRTYLNGLQYQGKGNSLNSMTFGNGTAQSFTLNDRLQMINQTLTKGADVIQKYDYNYGQIDPNTGSIIANSNNGQLATVESHIGTNKQWTKKYSYDKIGRLSKEEEYRGDNAALVYRNQYDYDRFGNLYRKQTANPNSLSSAWIEDSHISKSTNRFTIGTTYDDAGNVLQDTKFRNLNYSYDANGRMFKTSNIDNTNQAASVYDASGQRVATKHYDLWTFYIYDAFGKMVAEYGGLQGTDEGGVKYVLSDWQGSTRAITNNTGVVQARMDYTAFGEEIQAGVGQRTTQQGFGANQNLRNKYALTERDQATGLDHTWFRKNENKAGRWTSPDPYNGSMSLGNPQSFNRYSYVENDPTNFVDPSGLLKEGEACQINGQVDRNGDPVYQGTVVNGRCQSHAGSPVVISGGWLFPISWGGGGVSTIINPQGLGSGISGGGVVSDGGSGSVTTPPAIAQNDREVRKKECFENEKRKLDRKREEFRNNFENRIINSMIFDSVRLGVAGGIIGGFAGGIGAVPGAIIGTSLGGVHGVAKGVLMDIPKRTGYYFHYHFALEQARKFCDAYWS